MARFEWLTPERVMKSMGLLAGLGLLAIGTLNLYLWTVVETEFVLFGVDGLLLTGGLQVVAGLFFLVNEFKFRPRIS